MEQKRSDAGLDCLAFLLRFHGLAVDPAQIAHRFAGVPIGVDEMLRGAKELKLKARAVTADWTRLKRLALPAIAECADGGFFILAKVADDSALVHAPSAGRPQVLARAELETQWTGRLVLMARR